MVRDSVSELIAAVDPQLPGDADIMKIITLVHRTQLLLDEEESSQAAANQALNELALEATGWLEGAPDPRRVLQLQNNLLNATKPVIFNPRWS